MKEHLRRYINNMKLEKKLLISYLLFAVIPMLLIGIVICIASFRIIIRQTREYADIMIERINHDVDGFVENIERQAYSIYTDLEIQKILMTSNEVSFMQQQDNKDLVHKRLIGMWVTEKYIVGSYLCSTDGGAYFTNINERNDIMPSEVFAEESWFSEIENGTKKSVLTGIHSDGKYSDSSDLRLISYVHGINNISTGQYMGFLVIDIDVRVLEELAGRHRDLLGGDITILDSERNVMYTTAQKQEGSGVEFPITMENISDKTGWMVQLEIPLGQFIKEVYHIFLITLGVEIFCMMVFIWLSRKISKNISMPLEELQKVMELVEQGDMEVEVRIEREDEIGKLAGSFNHMVCNIKELIDKVYITQLGKKEAEFSALQSQINPHFMYNTLETVNMMAILEGNYEISDLLTAFGKILRVNLDQKNNIIFLTQELEYIENYVKILQMRDHELFTFEIHTSDQANICRIPKLTLQPLVENSIIHGFKEKMSHRHLVIEADVAEGYLTITIQDDGKGMTPERLEDVRQSLELEESIGKKASIGLNNVNERCQLFFGKSFQMDIESQRSVGTKITLKAQAIYGEGNGNGTDCGN